MRYERFIGWASRKEGGYRNSRYYDSFEDAERWARRLVKNGHATRAFIETAGPRQRRVVLAHIVRDALDRVWTDLTEEGARIV